MINSVKHYRLPESYGSGLRSNRHRDAIEGIWNAGNGLQVAIIRISANTFYGVVKKTAAPRWQPGMVKLELTKVGVNRYNAVLYRNDFAKVHFSDLSISKNAMFSFGIYRFGRIFPLNPEIRYIDPQSPDLPTLRVLDKKKVLLTIPSALIDRQYLDSILTGNMEKLTTTPNLIIDLRGNGGGNNIWDSIYDLANTVVKPKARKAGDSFLMLASEDDAVYVDNIGAYSRQQKDSAAARFYDQEVAKIRANTGHIIGFSYYRGQPDTARRKIYRQIRNVAVILDRNVASAGEGFVIDLRETSSKVILYGDNTHGMIDYMNVNTLPVGGKNCDWYYLGYPTFFAKDIKTAPLNPTGIKPDVYIPGGVADWVEWVRQDLRRRQ